MVRLRDQRRAAGRVSVRSATAVKKEYGYRGGQLLVVWDNDKSGNERLKWLITDHLGSTRMEADLSGSLAGMRRHDYLPFGEELTSAHGAQRVGVGYEPPPSNVRQKFTGKERDGETGLDYFLARYYASTQARFTSPDEFTGGPTELFAEFAAHNPTFYADIFDPQSLNKYIYCLNNPLKFIDPDGHVPDIAVIENGPTEGNPIGHTAIAVTGYGVFSFGNNTELGSSLIDYVNREAPRRDTKIYIIKTTHEQDKAVVDALLEQDEKGKIERYPDNCTSRSSCGLDAAGIPKATKVVPSGPNMFVVPLDPSIPGTPGARAQNLPKEKVKTISIPKDSKTLPINDLKQFEPTKPSRNPRLPKKENEQGSGRGTS